MRGHFKIQVHGWADIFMLRTFKCAKCVYYIYAIFMLWLLLYKIINNMQLMVLIIIVLSMHYMAISHKIIKKCSPIHALKK